MKIIDAYWEKRNLGVSTKEVLVEEQDSAIDIKKALSAIEHDAEYLVFKVPIARFDI